MQYASNVKENNGCNTSVAPEMNVYTFGAWVLSRGDNGTPWHHRDNELMAVNATLLLQEVKGPHSINTKYTLRILPLWERMLDMSNLKVV